MRDVRAVQDRDLPSAVLDGMPDATVLVRRDGVITFANRRVEVLLGWPVHDLVGRSVETLVPAHGEGVHVRLREEYVADPRVRVMGSGLELDARHRDGREIAVEISLSPVVVDSEEFVVAAIRDAREQRALRTAVIEERNRATALIDALPEGVLEYDLDIGACITVNSRFCEMIGLAEHDVLATRGLAPWWMPDDTTVNTAARERARPGEITHSETRLRHSTGRVIPATVTSTVVSRNGTRTLLELFHDVTEERQTAAALEEARAAMAVLDDRDRIACDLHDGVIQSLFAAGLRLQASIGRPDQDERLHEVVDHIDEAIKEIRSTVFRLQNRVHFGSSLGDSLHAVVGESARVLGYVPSLDLHGAVESIPATVAAEMVAVIRESLSNVAKHAKATAAAIGVVVGDSEIDLSIEDNGVGFSPDLIPVGSGVRNLRERAIRLGGTMTIRPATPHGTIIGWTVPRASAG